MELAGVEAVCAFYGPELYNFLEAGDVLDESAYDTKELCGANHDLRKLMIALEIVKRIQQGYPGITMSVISSRSFWYLLRFYFISDSTEWLRGKNIICFRIVDFTYFDKSCKSCFVMQEKALIPSNKT